jgi:membrane-associated phospholipid phosphatase
MGLSTLALAVINGAARRLFWLSWLLSVLGFAVLAGFAAATDYFPGDRGLTDRIQDLDAPALTNALDWASDLADTPLVLAVALGGALGLWLLRRRPEAAWLVVALVAPWLNWLVKLLVDRPRPSPDLVHVTADPSTSSFPSGHVVTAVLVYGFIFYLSRLLIPQRTLRYSTQGACLAILVLTALQRVNAGVHWPSDVLGGLLFGGLLLSLLIWSHRRYLSSRLAA